MIGLIAVISIEAKISSSAGICGWGSSGRFAASPGSVVFHGR